MPIPVSWTATTTSLPSFSERETFTVPPEGVYLMSIVKKVCENPLDHSPVSDESACVRCVARQAQSPVFSHRLKQFTGVVDQASQVHVFARSVCPNRTRLL